MRLHALAVLLATAVLCGCSGDPSAEIGGSPSGAPQTAVFQSDAPTSDAFDSSQTSPEETGDSSFYTVDKYDPDANPADDLAKTVSLALERGKRIILEIGGKW